jgi:hypothetical protein
MLGFHEAPMAHAFTARHLRDFDLNFAQGNVMGRFPGGQVCGQARVNN